MPAGIEVYNPATGELIGTVPGHDPDEVTATVARARAAQPAWAAAGFAGARRVLRRAQKWTDRQRRADRHDDRRRDRQTSEDDPVRRDLLRR